MLIYVRLDGASIAARVASSSDHKKFRDVYSHLAAVAWTIGHSSGQNESPKHSMATADERRVTDT